MSIFNRWGQLMFETDDINNRWDGTTAGGNACPDGTYFYVVNAKSMRGDLNRNGTITLIHQKQ